MPTHSFPVCSGPLVQSYHGINFTFLNAGHVLGAAMIAIEIAGVRVRCSMSDKRSMMVMVCMQILYTGDYSCEEDRHLPAAEVCDT